MIKNMTSKITTNNYQQLKLKKQIKNELRKQLEQEHNHKNGDHMEGCQQGWGERNGGNSTGNKLHQW